MVAAIIPGVEQANRTDSPHAEVHGYKTIADIMRLLNRSPASAAARHYR